MDHRKGSLVSDVKSTDDGLPAENSRDETSRSWSAVSRTLSCDSTGASAKALQDPQRIPHRRPDRPGQGTHNTQICTRHAPATRSIRRHWAPASRSLPSQSVRESRAFMILGSPGLVRRAVHRHQPRGDEDPGRRHHHASVMRFVNLRHPTGAAAVGLTTAPLGYPGRLSTPFGARPRRRTSPRRLRIRRAARAGRRRLRSETQ